MVGLAVAVHELPAERVQLSGSSHVAFNADHMIERCRLFLIIALGETVLTTGTALAQAPRGFLAAVTGSLSLLSIVSLWILYFGGSGRLPASTADPIRSARLAMNGEVVLVAGLIAPAVGQEIVIVHPTVTHRPP